MMFVRPKNTLRLIAILLAWYACVIGNSAFSQEPGTPREISANISLGKTTVGLPTLINNGERVVYRVLDAQNKAELFSANTALLCASPVKLSLANSPTSFNGVGFPHRVTKNGLFVIYSHILFGTNIQTLFRVRSNGSGSQNLYPGIENVSGQRGIRRNFKVSQDSKSVVFILSIDPTSDSKLMVVPVTASAEPSMLAGLNENETFEGTASNGEFFLSADSGYAVYRTINEETDIANLYSVRLDGSTAPVKLHGDLMAGQTITRAFSISPDNKRVVFVADLDQTTDQVFELYSVPITGVSAPVAISGTLPALSTVGQDFLIDGNSDTVVFTANRNLLSKRELFSAPILGNAEPILLNSDSMIDDGDISVFSISPNNLHVAYIADESIDAENNLYISPIDGSSDPVKVNANLPPDGDVSTAKFSTDSTRIVYRADGDSNDVLELYSSTIDGANNVKLNPDFTPNADLIEFLLGENTQQVLYLADQDVDGQFELYRTNIDGTGNPIKMNHKLAPGELVSNGELAMSEDYIVYSARNSANDGNETYVVAQDKSNDKAVDNCSLFFPIRTKDGNTAVIHL